MLCVVIRPTLFDDMIVDVVELICYRFQFKSLNAYIKRAMTKYIWSGALDDTNWSEVKYMYQKIACSPSIAHLLGDSTNPTFRQQLGEWVAAQLLKNTRHD